MFKIIIAFFEIEDEEKKSLFFKKIFVSAKFSTDIILGILSLNWSNVKINFLKLKLFWKTYTLIKTISRTKQVKLVDKKAFVVATLDLEKKTYIVPITSFNSFNLYVNYFV